MTGLGSKRCPAAITAALLTALSVLAVGRLVVELVREALVLT